MQTKSGEEVMTSRETDNNKKAISKQQHGNVTRSHFLQQTCLFVDLKQKV